MAHDTPDSKDDENKNKGGRPLKFKTVAELDMAIQAYFDEQDPHIVKHMEASGFNERGQTTWAQRDIMTEQRPYTMSGLARAIGLDRKTLLNYKNRDEFFPSVQAAIDRCEEYAEGQLFGPYANGAKFNLQNNYNGKYQPWTDKQVISGDPDAPVGLFGAEALTIKVINAGADTQPEAADDVRDS